MRLFQKTSGYSIAAADVAVRHDALGHDIRLLVPLRAKHRPAVKEALAGRCYEPFSHLSFARILEHKANKSAIHAGAFFGDMLHTYSRAAERVYAFEPVLDNYVLAKLNAQKLGLHNVLLFNAGLSDRNGVTSIQTVDSRGRFLGGGSSIADGRDGTDGAEDILTLRIDDLPVADIGLIQLDVEGHELAALRGAVATIRAFSPVILIEDNNDNCAALLTELGYGFRFARDGLRYWATAEDAAFVSSLNRG